MVRSCGWGHPRPRLLQSYRGLGQSPSGNYLPTYWSALYALSVKETELFHIRF